MFNKAYPKTNHAIIRNTKIFLNLGNDHIVTFHDVDNFKKLMMDMLFQQNMSPSDIAKTKNLDTSYNFSLFLSKCLGIALRSCKEAGILTHTNNHTNLTDAKKKYKLDCKFSFSPWRETWIIGYELLNQFEFRKIQDQIPGDTYLHRDHMVSIAYGWENNISPSIISHPANCHIMTNFDNYSKSSGCSISFEHLLDRIAHWGSIRIPIEFIDSHRLPSHNMKISETLKKI